MDVTKGYRNKVQVPFGMADGKVIYGFYRQRSHDITPMTSCVIQSDLSSDILKFIRNLCNEYHIPAYEEETERGFIRHVLIKESRKNGDVMVVLVMTTDKVDNLSILVQKITKRYSQVKSIILNINPEKTNVILGRKFTTLYGSDVIVDSLGGLDFEIGANTFYQVNPVQTEKLYGKAIEYAKLTGKETVIDAYCGIGTIGLLASRHAKEVYGVEIVEEAIENARRNANINNITNAKFVANNSEDQIIRWNEEGIKADVIFVDPPRKGCERKFLETVIAMKIPRIVYVSCDAGTLARDLRILADNGYEVKEIQPVDMFPHTSHIENVVLIERK
jgi:23S rRNA (uracil1939-C5)-methyltransferase